MPWTRASFLYVTPYACLITKKTKATPSLKIIKHLDGEGERVLDAHLALLVLLLQLRHGRRRVVADAGRLPTAVVA